MEKVAYRDLGTIGYARCWALQQELFEGLVKGKTAGSGSGEPTLILCEHPHVYTLGKSGQADNLLINETFLNNIGATFVRIDRGGDITYHGPGQIVGYPILDLERLGIGLREYIHGVEQAVIETLAGYGIEATRSHGAAGVWLEAADGQPLRKICAIGVRSSRYVTMHGFALNVNTALEYFTYINPCGFRDRGVTSMQRELGKEIDIEMVKKSFAAAFSRIFGVELA